MLGIAAPPFKNEREEDKKQRANNGIGDSKTPAVLITDKVRNHISLLIKLIRELLGYEAVLILGRDNSITYKQPDYSVTA